MAVTYVFNTKVVNDEAEENRAPFVAPKTSSGGALIVSVLGSRGVLNFGAIADGCVLLGGKLTLIGVRVIPL